jgi:TM2 domain-containing membrane protein YozV
MTSESTAVGVAPKSKLIAGLLAFVLGPFGIHWFYLGDNSRGLKRLIPFIVGIPLCFVLIGIPIVIGIQIWTFVEAIQIFMGSINKDGQGNLLA